MYGIQGIKQDVPVRQPLFPAIGQVTYFKNNPVSSLVCIFTFETLQEASDTVLPWEGQSQLLWANLPASNKDGKGS